MKKIGVKVSCNGAKSTFTLSKSEILRSCEESLQKKGYKIEGSKLNISKTGRVSVTVRCDGGKEKLLEPRVGIYSLQEE